MHFCKSVFFVKSRVVVIPPTAEAKASQAKHLTRRRFSLVLLGLLFLRTPPPRSLDSHSSCYFFRRSEAKPRADQDLKTAPFARLHPMLDNTIAAPQSCGPLPLIIRNNCILLASFSGAPSSCHQTFDHLAGSARAGFIAAHFFRGGELANP